MSDRHFPVRPNLVQLRHQTKDLLRAIRQGDPFAAGELGKHHPEPIEPGDAKLRDTPLGWGHRFHNQNWVSPPTMRLIAERGGHL